MIRKSQQMKEAGTRASEDWKKAGRQER
ncbi:hypothetical protein CLS_22910 [[Clostridium] cf. saccharolyticum K10]|nr:hypothetical protein CLS_22910 [[Clostridium] cf. saccharolyticum K10]